MAKKKAVTQSLNRRAKPKARTKPTRQELLYAYAEWLHFERNFVMAEAHPTDPTGPNDSYGFNAPRFIPCGFVNFRAHDEYWKNRPPSKRAAKVLKAVGAKVRLDSPFSAERVKESAERRKEAAKLT